MRIAVIGGGVSGLASAARLAARGHQVDIYEKNKQIGGRMNQIKQDGFTFDMGPTIVMMPEIYQDVFKYANRDINDYLEIKQLSHIYDVYFSDDDQVRVPTDLSQLRDMLESIEPNSTHGFMSFLTDIYERYEIARKHFLERTFRKPSDFYNPYTLYQGMKLKTFDNADNLIEKYVANDKIQKILAFQTLYIGIDPKKSPSLYSIIPMIELMFGVHFIKGGMYRFAEALQTLNEELGTHIYTGTNVEEIIIDPRYKRAEGLKVEGRIERYDKVLCTADFPYAASSLIKKSFQSKKYTTENINNMDYSCSAFLMYIGVDLDLSEEILLHNVIFSQDFDENIKEIFNGTLSEDPSIYVYAPSVEDKTLAPEGQTGIYVLMPVSELKTGHVDWTDEVTVSQVKEIVYKKMATVKALAHVKEHIVTEIIFTPKDFESHYHAKFGAAFGLMPTLAQSNYYRPPNISRNYQNLYFAGASVHPGAGVPIVLTSAKITVDAMLEDIEKGI
ncbi:phytoene desaturase family protein [Mammaliicoccus sciuri]|uniref:4,4'-diapophytoene desaturase (4,4'-diaponeurosporene-forming) n=1 Tax=Mammaliicoccus sciuri TaxID=1296 RepID=A0AAI8DKN7_MAMSC|nr:phytoene desaturase family protein [Mammaliicoccus sciuri]ASE35495.1 phytoene desaturase [Mammaliicoccus sciuri]